MKTLLVTLRPRDDFETVLDVASTIARPNGAHVVGYMPIPGLTAMMVGGPDVVIPFDDSLQKKFKEQRPTIQNMFESRMKSEGLSFEFRSDQCLELNLMPGIIEQGRTCDMVIVQMTTSRGDVSARSAGAIADLTLALGRPVVVVPPKLPRIFSLDRITVAWDGSRESARAAFDSIPLQKGADEVDVIWINPEKSLRGNVDVPGAEIANVLARHDINVTAKPIISRKKARLAIVDEVDANATDVLVLGAYGHSRLRERIWGGVTEHLLRNLPCVVMLSN